MTPAQRSAARGALGLPNDANRSHMNSFRAVAGGRTDKDWLEMVGAGLAVVGQSPNLGFRLYHLTEAGARQALDEGETLDPKSLPVAEARVIDPPVGYLRSDAEAVVKAAAWLARRAELLLANIRDGRHATVGADALAGAVEAEHLSHAFEKLASEAGIGATAIAEALS
ncbi:hypothetical protein [Bosea sp. MMO-172]|uniref:hypothetical protein n=1 Tax=Bosea sp. MMO-172 TaxID=3127885 RepID=UPI00301AE990